MGEVDDDVAAGQRVKCVTLIDFGADLQVRRLGNGPDHLVPIRPRAPRTPSLAMAAS